MKREESGVRSEEKQKFLSRWSRMKEEAREQPQEQPSAAPAVDPKSPPPELPPVDKLTIDSDFRDFFHPKVDENLRRAALKKLFSDPHFNVMDGLDVYIDDYSQPNPLPAAMLAGLKQAQNILEWAREGKAEARAAESTDPPADRLAQPTESAAPVQPDHVPVASEAAQDAAQDARESVASRRSGGSENI